MKYKSYSKRFICFLTTNSKTSCIQIPNLKSQPFVFLLQTIERELYRTQIPSVPQLKTSEFNEPVDFI